MRLDPRTKLAAMAAMAVAVALAPNLSYEALLMGLAGLFGVLLGKGRVSAAMVALYVAFLFVAHFVVYVDDVALRTMLASFPCWFARCSPAASWPMPPWPPPMSTS